MNAKKSKRDPKDYVVAKDVQVTEVDLDKESITLPSGRVLDEAAAAEYGEEIAARAAVRRGRPSLTRPGVHSPQISVRVNPDLRAAVQELADDEGIRPADLFRRALEEYVQSHRRGA
jgi:hypothetical protein